MWSCHKMPKLMLHLLELGDICTCPDPQPVPFPKNLWLEQTRQSRGGEAPFSKPVLSWCGHRGICSQKHCYYPVVVDSIGNIRGFLQQLIWSFGDKKISSQQTASTSFGDTVSSMQASLQCPLPRIYTVIPDRLWDAGSFWQKMGIQVCGVLQTQRLAFCSLVWHFIPAIDCFHFLPFLEGGGGGDINFF